jgi:hypothetical protein
MAQVSDIGVAGHIGPVLREDASAPRVDLALERDSVSCSLKSEVEASDAAEERSNREHVTRAFRSDGRTCVG